MELPNHNIVKYQMVVFLMLGVCLSPCAADESNSEGKRARDIRIRVESGLAEAEKKRRDSIIHPQAIAREFLGSLSNDEIGILAREAHVSDLVKEEAIYHLARFDPKGALEEILQLVESVKAESAVYRQPGAIGEVAKGFIQRLYFNFLLGWSETEPKVAWESFKNPDTSLGNLAEFADRPSRYYEFLFHHLAKADPDLAFEEIRKFQADGYSEYSIARMLSGYLHGAPNGRDWGGELNRLLERNWEQKWVKNEIRTALMARWLEDSPEAAEKWFSSGDVKGLHLLDLEEPDGDLNGLVADEPLFEGTQEAKIKRRYHLGTAAGYWAARDFEKAWEWMKSYSDFRQKGFAEAVLYGVNNYRSNAVTYIFTGVGGEESTRTYILEQAAVLEDERDRAELALRFAEHLWVFHEMKVLVEPPTDKAKWLGDVRKSISKLQISSEATEAIVQRLQESQREPDAAGQPATRPESK